MRLSASSCTFIPAATPIVNLILLLCPSVNNIKKLKINLILPFHFHCFNTLPFTPAATEAATPTLSPSKHQQHSPLSFQSTSKRSPSSSSLHSPLQSNTTHFHFKIQITLHPTQTFKESIVRSESVDLRIN